MNLDYILYLLKSSWRFSKKALLVVITYTLIIALFIIFTKKPNSNSTTLTTQNLNLQIPSSIRQNKNLTIAYKKTLCVMTGEYCTDNPKDVDKYRAKSVTGFLTGIIVFPYTHPPASFTYWAMNGLQNSGFVPKTYAMGIGFASIRSLIPIWSAFRNIAYILLVLVLVAIGFMIMFRMKINPQTVISIESALPRIVITLILITFSFAIAGLLIDLMYLTIALVVYVFASANHLNTTREIVGYIQAGPGVILGKTMGGQGFFKNIGTIVTLSSKMLQLMGKTWAVIIASIFNIIITFLFTFPYLVKINFLGSFQDAVPELGASIGLTATTGILKGLVKGGTKISYTMMAFAITGIILPLILALIFLLTLISIFFRIIFMLISSYIKIILYIILAPLFILLNAVPGKNAFTSWLQNLIAELLTFPVLAAIFMIGQTIMLISGGTAGQDLFKPPFMFGIAPDVFSALAGMTILFMTPDLIQIVKKLIVPKPLPMPEFGPGVFFGSVGAVAGGFQTGMGFASVASYIAPVSKFLSKFGINPPGGQRTPPTPDADSKTPA